VHVLFLNALGRVDTRVLTLKLRNELPRVYYWNTYGTGSPEEFNVHTPNELPRVKTHRVTVVTYLWLLMAKRTNTAGILRVHRVIPNCHVRSS